MHDGEGDVNLLAETNVKFGEWGVVLIVVVGAFVFTLAWWKIADRWADSERKRFGQRKSAEPVERVVIRTPGSEKDDKPAR